MAKTIEKVILGIIIITIFGIGGFAIAGFGDNPQKTNTGSIKQISLEEAKTIALGAADGEITEAFLENEDGKLVYEIEITDGNLETDVLIDPSNGNILSVETDEEEEVTAEEIANIGDKISEEQAISIARNAVDISSVGEMTDVELENEDGVIVYAVEFTKNGIETDVKINAATGEVLKIESDLDEEEDDEGED